MEPHDRKNENDDAPISSTSNKTTEGSKRITRQTNEKEDLDTFQNKDMTPGEWDELAEQVLTRGF